MILSVGDPPPLVQNSFAMVTVLPILKIMYEELLALSTP